MLDEKNIFKNYFMMRKLPQDNHQSHPLVQVLKFHYFQTCSSTLNFCMLLIM